jgi:hypothetical protein
MHFNLGTRWRCVVRFTLRRFYLKGMSPRYPLDRRLGGRGGEEKTPYPYKDSYPGRPACNIVTMLNELLRVHSCAFKVVNK